MLSDIEIAQSAELKPIAEIANQLGFLLMSLSFTESTRQSFLMNLQTV